MTDVRKKRTDGVRHLEDLRLRCFIDTETGCWLWRGALSHSKTRKVSPTTRVWLPAGIHGDGAGAITTASKAAWLLSGRKLKDGHVVWRAVCNQTDCINPQHCKGVSRQQMHAEIAASNRLKGNPTRAAINAINGRASLMPVATVRQAESLFASGAMLKDVKQQLGISSDVAKRIRQGLHPHCANASRLVRGASVFALGAHS